MATINVILVVGVMIFPFVENAPSTNVKTLSTEDLRTRLVFVDKDADEPIYGNLDIKADRALPSPLNEPAKSSIATSKQFVRSVENLSNFNVKAIEPSALSQMDDDRRIWGIAVDNKELEQDESYYNRPIALPKNVPKFLKQTTKHIVSETINADTPIAVPKPSACDVSIVVCCGNPSKLKECFISQGCINVTEDMFPYLCSSVSINRVTKDLGKYYKSSQSM